MDPSNDVVVLFPELVELEREAAGLARQLQSAHEAAAEASGRDPSEQVRVTLDTAGRVVLVEVSTNWRAGLDGQALPAAVLAAYGDAVSRRLETWAAEITSGTPIQPVDNSVPAPSHSSRLAPIAVAAEAPTGESAQYAVRRSWSLLEDASDRLDQVMQEVKNASGTAATGRDPDGRVTVTMAAGQPADLDVDERWVARASGHEIGKAITDAIVAGYVVTMAPNDQQIKAAIEALRADASTWSAASDVLHDAARTASRQDLDAFHFSYLGDLVGVTAIYQQLQQKLQRLLGEGADNFTALTARCAPPPTATSRTNTTPCTA